MKHKYKSHRIFVNRDIRARNVRCINHQNKNLGVIPIQEALQLAEEQGLDLVMITRPSRDQVPTCKILSYGKYKYDLDKKNKELAKKRRESTIKIKEIKFRPTTDIHDLKTLAKRAEKFLTDGCRIKIAIKFKGREMSHIDVARERLDQFVELIENVEFFEHPQMNGRFMTCMLARKKDNKIVTKQAI